MVAAGLKKTVGDAYDPVGVAAALELAGGTALVLAGDAAFRHTLGIPRSGPRLAVALLAFATIPVGTLVAGAPQVALLAGLVTLGVGLTRAAPRARASELPRPPMSSAA